MKVRYLGESNPICLLNGKVYDVLAVEDGWYRILDEEGDWDGQSRLDIFIHRKYLRL